MASAIAEIPVDTRELPFLVHGKSTDFQDVAVQGEISFRVVAPEELGKLVDFSIDLRSGLHLKQPLDQLTAILVGHCQQIAAEYTAQRPVREILAAGPIALRDRIEAGMQDLQALHAMGLEVLAVRVTAVNPTPELEKALQTPTREQLQQEADEATFQRRALAVEKERAIAENELQNQIELARQEQRLIEQQGSNARRRAEEEAAARAIDVAARAESTRVEANAQADRISMIEGARVTAEKDRIGIFQGLPPAVLLGLAAQEAAAKLTSIEHLSITPDMLATGISNLLGRAAQD